VSTIERPVRASTIWTSAERLSSAAAIRRLSRVTSKWTIAGVGRPGSSIGAEFAITHSCVSGETYGRDWKTSPGRSAKVGPKKDAFVSFGDRCAMGSIRPLTALAFSAPAASMKHASPMLPGNSVSR
jgi:hypothetical protein